MITDFTLNEYENIVKTILKTHKTFSFRDAYIMDRKIFDHEKFVIMRHDIEFSLDAALDIAMIDMQHGIHSTFFLLQTSEYNCFEEEEANIIKTILSWGHDIGLHYDAGLFQRLGVHATATAVCQIRLFEEFFKTKVYAMSSHMPMRSGITFTVPGVIDTYNPMFMVEMKYISDSLQVWREGGIIKNLQEYDRIHLLTHEFWTKEGFGWPTLLFTEAKEKFFKACIRAEALTVQYSEGLKLREIKDAQFRERYNSSL